MKQFITNLRQKPEHIRRAISVGVSSVITVLVAVAWIGTQAANGNFSLAPKAQNAGGNVAGAESAQVAKNDSGSSFSQLLGAVGAGAGVTGKGTASTAPELTIVDQGSSSSLDRGDSTETPTVIRF
jgi:hypothetical protein